MARLQQAIDDRLREALELIQNRIEVQEEFPHDTVVPRHLVEREPPGLPGADYWDLYRMAEEMHSGDAKMNYASLRIIGDEIWNFADGRRSVSEIAEAIGAEFDFHLQPRYALALFQGLAKAGFVALE